MNLQLILYRMVIPKHEMNNNSLLYIYILSITNIINVLFFCNIRYE